MQKRWWYLLFLVPLFYRPIFGLLLIFFLPGLGFILNLFEKTKLHEKIALSIALSLSVVVLNGFFLNSTFGLNFTTVFISLLLVSLIPLVIYFKRKKALFKKIKIPKLDKKQISKIFLLLFCLSVLAVKIYKPHFNNPYPIHLDEYSRLLETTHIIEEESFNNRFNPQFVGHPEAGRRLNPGFQLILSQFYIISGVDQIEFFQYLPAFFAVLTGFILFSFLTKISSYWTGLFGIIFLSFMKTNDNTLGIAFLIALTMVFPLLYSLFYSLYNGFKKKKSLYFLLASFIYFTISVTHEQTGAAFLPIIFFFLILNIILYFIYKKNKLDITKKRVLIIMSSIIIPFFSFYVARKWLWKGNFTKTWTFFLDLIVWEGTNQIRYAYNFVLFYGIILSILAVIGAIMIFRNLDMNIFLIWSLVAVSQVVIFHLNHITYFSFIERVRHHAVLGLVPLSAYGVYSIIYLISKSLKKHQKKIIICLSIVVILIASVASLNYKDKGEYLPEDKRPKQNLVMSPTIDYKDYQSILFLKNISYKKIVLADPKTSAAIYPISKNYIVASSQNKRDGFGGGRINQVKKFFATYSCLDKQRIAYQNNVKYILSTKPINCPSFKQIYSENFRYIYELK